MDGWKRDITKLPRQLINKKSQAKWKIIINSWVIISPRLLIITITQTGKSFIIERITTIAITIT